MARMKSKAVRLLLRWSETKPRLTAPDARDLQFMPESETWGAAVDRQQSTDGRMEQKGGKPFSILHPARIPNTKRHQRRKIGEKQHVTKIK